MIDPERTLVIANPAARGGFVRKNWASLEARIRAVLGPVHVVTTAGPRDATAIAASAVRDRVTTVVSYGGDGTHGEVVDGLMQAPAEARPSLGILHAGTGGDFRRMLLGTHGLEAGCRLVAVCEPVPIDVGYVEYRTGEGGGTAGRYFLNLASVGMSGMVDRFVERSGKRLGGTVSFGLATFRAQASFRPPRLRVEVDGVKRAELRAHVVCVANGRYAGGGMMFAPEARLSDGQFEVIALESAPLLRMLPAFAGLYSGRHLRSRLVRSWRGGEIRVTPLDEGHAFMDVDGEAPGVAPATFRIHRHALRVHGVRPEVI